MSTIDCFTFPEARLVRPELYILAVIVSESFFGRKTIYRRRFQCFITNYTC